MRFTRGSISRTSKNGDRVGKMSGPEPLNAPKIEKTPAGAFLEEVPHVGEKFHAVTKGPAPTKGRRKSKKDKLREQQSQDLSLKSD